MRRGLRGLSDAPGDIQSQIDTLQAQLDKVNAQLANPGSIHLIGIPEMPNDPQSAINFLQTQANGLTAQISSLQAKLTTAQTVAAALPAAAAQAAQDQSAQLRQEYALMAGPKYDYGVGSSRRNKFFAQMDGPEPPVRFLGADIFSAITQAVEQQGLNAVKGASLSDPALANITSGTSVPSAISNLANVIPLPSWLTSLHVSIPNAGKLVSAVQQNMRAQTPAKTATSTAAKPGAKPSSSGLSLWAIVGLGVGGLVLVRAMRRSS